jgi:3-phenylpropionate/trans-cinnamate dioxygenase ferredoxin subunit
MTAAAGTRLCALADLTAGSSLRVELADLDVAVVRVGDEVFAIEDVCSHAEVPLSDGEIDGCTIECALHGSRFDLRSGKPTGPPATQPVPVFPTTVIDGEVFADLSEPISPSLIPTDLN